MVYFNSPRWESDFWIYPVCLNVFHVIQHLKHIVRIVVVEFNRFDCKYPQFIVKHVLNLLCLGHSNSETFVVSSMPRSVRSTTKRNESIRDVPTVEHIFCRWVETRETAYHIGAERHEMLFDAVITLPWHRAGNCQHSVKVKDLKVKHDWWKFKLRESLNG